MFVQHCSTRKLSAAHEKAEQVMSSDSAPSIDTEGASSSRIPQAAPSGLRVMTIDERSARRDRVWQKYLDGKLVTIDEYRAHHRVR
jgi:hypothetical protein